MKAECNVNIDAVTNIVNEMMAEKNKLGRQVFKHMVGEATPGSEGTYAMGGGTPGDQGILRARQETEHPSVKGYIESMYDNEGVRLSGESIQLLMSYAQYLKDVGLIN